MNRDIFCGMALHFLKLSSVSFCGISHLNHLFVKLKPSGRVSKEAHYVLFLTK